MRSRSFLKTINFPFFFFEFLRNFFYSCKPYSIIPSNLVVDGINWEARTRENVLDLRPSFVIHNFI